MQIFFSELKTLYMEPNHQFIPLDITFRDYIDCDAYPINTQNDWEYWLTRLPQLPPAPQLPLIKIQHRLCNLASRVYKHHYLLLFGKHYNKLLSKIMLRQQHF